MDATNLADAIAAFKHTACFRELSTIIEEYDTNLDDAKLVQTKDKILDTCMKHGYASEVMYHVKQVGACPTNRDGEGLSYSRAHSRLSVIKSSGFSLVAFKQNAIAMEDNPEKTFGKYTANLAKASPGHARYDPFEIKIGCLGATHATHGLACCLDEVPCSIANISEGGKISMQKVFAGDEELKQACMKGIPFKTFRWEVGHVFPQVLKIVQRALNTVSQVAEGETWVQNLLNIIDEASKFSSCSTVYWMKIKKKVTQSSPPRVEDIPAMCDFVQKWGGMPTGMFVHDLASLCKQVKTNIVSGNFFQALANLKFPVDVLPAHLVNAVVFVTSHEQRRYNVAVLAR